MALQCVCDKGHTYIQADKYLDWPDGAPACPECCVEWLESQASEGKIRVAEDETGIQVYVDENGIGMFDESWLKEDSDGYVDCPRLRLNDVKTFLQFMYEIMVMAADLGWLPVDVMSL